MNAVPLLAATASFVAATLALTGVWWTVRQREKADRRAEWWRRATWALEQTTGDDGYSVRLGWAVIDGLVDSELATRTEETIMWAIATARMPSDEVDTG